MDTSVGAHSSWTAAADVAVAEVDLGAETGDSTSLLLSMMGPVMVMSTLVSVLMRGRCVESGQCRSSQWQWQSASPSSS